MTKIIKSAFRNILLACHSQNVNKNYQVHISNPIHHTSIYSKQKSSNPSVCTNLQYQKNYTSLNIKYISNASILLDNIAKPSGDIINREHMYHAITSSNNNLSWTLEHCNTRCSASLKRISPLWPKWDVFLQLFEIPHLNRVISRNGNVINSKIVLLKVCKIITA